VRLALMIEGQEGVTWDEWVGIAEACEEHGIETLFRSDHYLSGFDESRPPSLDAWATIAALAARTTRLRFGTLVSPVTFRHPSTLAKAVLAADHASGGRVELGLGAGWHEREHEAYGFPFGPVRERMDRLEEQLEIVHGHWADGSFSFSGRHYELRELDAQPKPLQRPHPPLLMGGSAGPRGARLAARWADEYNTVMATLVEVRERRGRIAAACEAAGREPIPFSMMTGLLVGRDRDELHTRARALAARRGADAADPAAFLASLPETWIVGTVEEAAEQLARYRDEGLHRVMLQHLLHTDLEVLAIIGRELAPRLA
jgi:F420-dependent oxidoreductase-like protein